MKISIGMNLQTGPFGGGNQFGKGLVKGLVSKQHQLVFDLKSPDIDIILLTEPRSELQISAYSDKHIWQYLRLINPKAIVVHRINECDERKATNNLNQRIIEANRCADHTVFVSTWLQELYIEQGIASKSYQVIRNGSDKSIFNSDAYKLWDGKEPLRLVTHHWGANWLKGFDIYQQIDELLADKAFSSKYHFTYIGNVPEGFEFKHTEHIQALSGKALADALRANHVYITASQNEPGPNHQNEGANCGLPLLYRPSGGLTEYCEGFGIAFTNENLVLKLDEMAATYFDWVEKIKTYPYNADATLEQYESLFKLVLNKKLDIIANRQWQAEAKWKRFLRQIKQGFLS